MDIFLQPQLDECNSTDNSRYIVPKRQQSDLYVQLILSLVIGVSAACTFCVCILYHSFGPYKIYTNKSPGVATTMAVPVRGAQAES